MRHDWPWGDASDVCAFVLCGCAVTARPCMLDTLRCTILLNVVSYVLPSTVFKAAISQQGVLFCYERSGRNKGHRLLSCNRWARRPYTYRRTVQDARRLCSMVFPLK